MTADTPTTIILAAEEPATFLHSGGFWTVILVLGWIYIAWTAYASNRSIGGKLFQWIGGSIVWIFVWSFLTFVGTMCGAMAVSYDEKTQSSAPATSQTLPSDTSPDSLVPPTSPGEQSGAALMMSSNG